MEMKVRDIVKSEDCNTFIDYQIHIKKLGEVAIALVLTSALSI
jgi:hypothetical protein